MKSMAPDYIRPGFEGQIHAKQELVDEILSGDQQ